MSTIENLQSDKSKKFKLAFLTRLGNIIIIQVLFVFTALIVILYFPYNIDIKGPSYIQLKEKYNNLALEIEKQIGLNGELSAKQNIELKDYINKLGFKDFILCNLYIEKSPDNIEKVITLNIIDGKANSDSNDGHEYLICEDILLEEIYNNNDALITTIPTTRDIINYYSFKLSNGKRAIIATVRNHGYMVTSKNLLLFPLITIFLASTLITLLLLYLINNRFKEPLNRLIKGFEKTAQGELYYMVEADADSELNNLVMSFNKMSKTLCNNDKELKSYNRQLEESNFKLTESQDFLATIIDSSPSSVITTLPDGSITVFNKKASEDFGYDGSEAIGMNIDDLLTHSIEEIKSGVKKTDDNTREVLCKRKDGSLFPSFMIFTQILSKNNRISAFLYIIRDISESKHFQEMMIRLDRYYTRGKMAGDIAHEINNFLAILSGNVELIPIILKKNDPERLNKKLELMKNTVDKISKFTDGLMDTGEDELKFVNGDINQLIETVLAFLKPQNKFDNIDISTNLSTDIPLVDFDEAQIQQLLVNMINNASDAMSDNENEEKINISTNLIKSEDGDKIAIEVCDSGSGVDKDKVKILFEKRFTTKRKGHGIGLIICKRIVDAHNGTIRYDYHNGARFTVILPVSKSCQDSQEAETIFPSLSIENF